MKKNSIGVALLKCPICGEGGEIIMNTRLSTYLAKKVEDMNGKTGHHPCSKCQDIIDGGNVFVIEIDPAKSSGDKNSNTMKPSDAYRTGRIAGVRGDAFEKVFNTQRPPGGVVFCDIDAFNEVGLGELVEKMAK